MLRNCITIQLLIFFIWRRNINKYIHIYIWIRVHKCVYECVHAWEISCLHAIFNSAEHYLFQSDKALIRTLAIKFCLLKFRLNKIISCLPVWQRTTPEISKDRCWQDQSQLPQPPEQLDSTSCHLRDWHQFDRVGLR